MSEQKKDAKPADYVYAGRRLGKGGKMLAAIFPITSEGDLGEGALYPAAGFKGKAIGGRYNGASFYEGGAYDLKAARYVSTWQDEALRLDWRVKDEAAAAEERQNKSEADARKAHEIEDMILPLRKLYAQYGRTNDFAGQEALSAALLRALRRRPRVDQ